MNLKTKKHKDTKKTHTKLYMFVSYLYFIFSHSQDGLNIDPSVITGCGGSLQGYSMVSVKSDFTLGEIAIETLNQTNTC